MRNHQFAIFLAAYIFAIATIAWAGYYFYADYSARTEINRRLTQDKTPRSQTDMAYVDLPRISVSLPSGNVRMDITLEVEGKYAAEVEGYRPVITDRLINFAQSLRYDDISHKQSTAWLRPEILEEAEKASGSARIKNVIFRQFVVL